MLTCKNKRGERNKENTLYCIECYAYRVNYNNYNNGNNATSGTVADMVISEGQNYTLPSSGFTRTGCNLQYWYAKDADGNYYFSNNGDKIWHSMSNLIRADVDFSGVVNAKDATAIQMYSSGVFPYF